MQHLRDKRKPGPLATAPGFQNIHGNSDNIRELARERQQALAAAGQYPRVSEFPVLDWKRFKWVRDRGIPPTACLWPAPIRMACGGVGTDGVFEPDEHGSAWLMFAEETDCIFWQPRTEEICSWSGRAFALGEDRLDIGCIFEEPMPILADPLDWLRRNRRGIVPIDWNQCFDRLRDLAGVAVAESILPAYRKHMRPEVPSLHVIPEGVPA